MVKSPPDQEKDVLRAFSLLEQTNSPKAKCEILRRHDCPLLRKVLLYALDPYKTYGIKQLPEYDPCLIPVDEANNPLDSLFELLDMLAARKYTGNRARSYVAMYLATAGKWKQLAERVILKDLRCGLQPKTVNSAFKGLIPRFEVMKAHDWQDYRHKYGFPLWGEEKWDGKRLTAFLDPEEGLVRWCSRNGLEQKGYNHIRRELTVMSKLFTEPMVVDHELMWGMWGKRTEENKVIRVFEIMPLSEWEGRVKSPPFIDRVLRLISIFDKTLAPNAKALSHILKSEGRIVDTQEELDEWFQEIMDRRGEGIMLKVFAGTYQKKRSQFWLKVKSEHSADLEIIDVFEGEKGKKYEGMLGGIIVKYRIEPELRKKYKIPDHIKSTVNRVGGGFTDEQRKELWVRDKITGKMGGGLIGQTAEVLFSELTPEGNFRHSRLKELREDK